MNSGSFEFNSIRNRLSLLIKRYGLKVPSEHGAVYTFLLSSVAALSVSGEKAPMSLLALMFLWLMGLTVQNLRLLFAVAFIGGLLLSGLSGNFYYALIYLLCLLGCRLLKAGRGLRESLGMFGAAAMPVILVSAGFDSVAQLYPAFVIALSITGAAFGASFAMHVAIQQINGVCLIEGILFLASVILLLFVSPWLASALLLPVMLQLVFRKGLGAMGLKRIGMIQALFITLVAVSTSFAI